MEMIDTHSHLFLDEFTNDLPEVIARARKAGVVKICMPSIDCATFESLMEVCRQYKDYCYPMIGLHPTSVNTGYEKELQALKRQLGKGHKFVAIGEVGMDLYWDTTFLHEQVKAFEEQIEWSLSYNLPLVIHSRNSFQEVFQMLEKYKDKPLSGIFHSFTGTLEEAQKLLGFPGFYLGINGVVTFKKSTLPEVLENVPLERVVLETDSPYLAPVPNRGKRNESANLKDTLLKLADIYRMEPEQIANITTKNALEVFKMSE